MSVLQLRPGGLEDISLISTLAHDIWWAVYPSIIGERQVEYMLAMMYNHDALQQQMTEQQHTFYIAEEEGKAIGFVSISHHHGMEQNQTRIHKLYLLGSSTGKGYGKAIIDFVSELSAKKGDAALELNVNKYNPAYHFYLHQGFTVHEEVIIEIGSGFVMDDYIMVKELKK